MIKPKSSATQPTRGFGLLSSSVSGKNIESGIHQDGNDEAESLDASGQFADLPGAVVAGFLANGFSSEIRR